MGKFNLLDEPWIKVIVDQKGNTKEVSLLTFFDCAHCYYGLAGETKTQDFAVMRVLLAVIHTVFSRVDENGKTYDYFELDDKWRQLNTIDDEDELNDYAGDLSNTWKNLWDQKRFPEIIKEYLEQWRDHFYLFDDRYPFYQVIKDDISGDKISKRRGTEVSGKNINRLISESNNQIAFFSPKFNDQKNKEMLGASEVVRWLIAYQNYTGLSDKVVFLKEKYKNSKGWLFDLGGITLGGNNLFETLLLNCALRHPEKKYWGGVQSPCWELSAKEVLARVLKNDGLDNLTQLYTLWSRAIYIDPCINLSNPFTCQVVKLPEIEHKDQFLELMTTWRYNESGEWKERFTPRKHRPSQAIWRSFGLLTISYAGVVQKGGMKPTRKPGLIDWLSYVNGLLRNDPISDRISLEAISMEDARDGKSCLPIDEIYDRLNLYDTLLIDTDDEGWVYRINDAVEDTKKMVEGTFKNFVSDIADIRNGSDKSIFISEHIESLYYKLDQQFRRWISGIQPSDSKEEKVKEWHDQLRKISRLAVDEIVKNAGPRDYKGITIGEEHIGKFKNIAVAHNKFMYFLNKQLPVREG